MWKAGQTLSQCGISASVFQTLAPPPQASNLGRQLFEKGPAIEAASWGYGVFSNALKSGFSRSALFICLLGIQAPGLCS